MKQVKPNQGQENPLPSTPPDSAAAQPVQSPLGSNLRLQDARLPRLLVDKGENSFSYSEILFRANDVTSWVAPELRQIVSSFEELNSGESPLSINERKVARFLVARERGNFVDALKHSSSPEPLLAKAQLWAGRALQVGSCSLGVFALTEGFGGGGAVKANVVIVSGLIFACASLLKNIAKATTAGYQPLHQFTQIFHADQKIVALENSLADPNNRIMQNRHLAEMLREHLTGRRDCDVELAFAYAHRAIMRVVRQISKDNPTTEDSELYKLAATELSNLRDEKVFNPQNVTEMARGILSKRCNKQELAIARKITEKLFSSGAHHRSP